MITDILLARNFRWSTNKMFSNFREILMVLYSKFFWFLGVVLLGVVVVVVAEWFWILTRSVFIAFLLALVFLTMLIPWNTIHILPNKRHQQVSKYNVFRMYFVRFMSNILYVSRACKMIKDTIWHTTQIPLLT